MELPPPDAGHERNDAGSTVDAGRFDAGTSTEDAGSIEDAGTDAGSVIDAGVIAPRADLEESFELPVLDAGASQLTSLPGWQISFPAGVEIHRPVAAELGAGLPLTAPADGEQVLRLTPPAGNYLDLRSPFVATIRPGEVWTLTYAVAVDATRGSSSHVAVFTYGDDQELVTDIDAPVGNTFSERSLQISLAPDETHSRALSFILRAYVERLFIDHIYLRRTYSPDAVEPQPWVPGIWNASLEEQTLMENEITPSGRQVGWAPSSLRSGEFITVWRPTTLNYTTAAPLAAPAEGNNVIELGTTRGLNSFDVRATSSVFAIAEAGRTYTATVAVGQRLFASNVLVCPNQTLDIVTYDGTVVASTQLSALDVTWYGEFQDVSVTTPAISAQLAGSSLKLRLRVYAVSASPLCRTSFDNMRVTSQ